MLDERMLIALIISTILAILLFRINYTKNVKIARANYTDKGNYNYLYLCIDIVVAISFAVIGCYLAWDSITTIPLPDYENYKLLLSILNGILFQQILPIIIEISMNKINAYKNANINKS